MENYMVYTPEAHIAITEVYAENGVVYLKFKKPKTQIYEVMTLDMFLSMVYQTLEKDCYNLHFGEQKCVVRLRKMQKRSLMH